LTWDLDFFIVALGVGTIAAAAAIARSIARSRRRRRLFAAPFPPEWEKVLERNVPLVARLPEPLKADLKGLVNVFVAEKNFEGCGGLEMTDEIRVTVAAQACVLLLNRKTRRYPRLISILVYPDAYLARGVQRLGRYWVEGTDVRGGESWPNGAVVVTWDSARRATGDLDDGHNIVLHEFAHQLDQEDGHADGVPVLDQRSSYVAWGRVLGKEFARLQRAVGRGRPTVLDEYGATNEAEFFAVATETFFEKSRQFKEMKPQLYEALKDYYKLDPAEW